MAKVPTDDGNYYLTDTVMPDEMPITMGTYERKVILPQERKLCKLSEKVLKT